MADQIKSKNRFLEDIVVRLFGKTKLSLSYKNPQKVADKDYKRIEEFMKEIQWLSGNLTKKKLYFGPKKKTYYSEDDIYNYNFYYFGRDFFIKMMVFIKKLDYFLKAIGVVQEKIVILKRDTLVSQN